MKIDELSSWGLTKAIFDVIENGFSYDEETGEVFFTGDDLEKLEETLDNKLNGVCGWIKKTESLIDGLKKRKSEIDESIKSYNARIERLQNFLKLLMEANGVDKKELPDYRLGFRKSSAVEISNEDLVYKFLEENPQYNDTCKKVETKTSLVKKELKEVLKTQAIPGACIVENKNVTIK